ALVRVQERCARTLSQGLQAFMPAAACLVWFGRTGQAAMASAVRLGLLAAIPLAAVASWLFQHSSSQAGWEAMMAIGVIGLALACGPAARRPRLVVAIAAALIVVRQSMLIAVAFGAAAFKARSSDATVAVVGAALLALLAAAGSSWLGSRLSQRGAIAAAATCAIVFLAQVVLYAIHRSAEARFLPWGDLLDAAT